MRIGVDARPLISESPSGIGVYLLEVLKNLEDNGNTYILYSNEPIKNQDPSLQKFEKRIVKGKIGTLVICFKLNKVLKADRIDEFWGTEHMLPLFTKGIRRVLTVHDLALLINPKWGSRKNAIMQNVFCRLSCKCADHIIAVSEATKKDICKLLHIKEQKIAVIYNGGGQNEVPAFSEEEEQEIRNRLKINDNRFFAYVGNIEPRKNIENIVKAFESAKSDLDGECKLVLAGKLGWRTEKIIQSIDNSRYKSSILLPGYISEREKEFLLQKAIAFVFPSNYEGFGIPIIEALSYGGVVITAQNSSLPEVGGEVAFYVGREHDVKDIAKKMLQCSKISVEQRSELEAEGKKWADQFGWKKCSKRTQEVLEIRQVCGEGKKCL